MLELVLRFPVATLVVAAILVAITAWPASRLGGEFLPPLDEGDLLYMPTALPGLSAGQAAAILRQTHLLIPPGPPGESVFWQIGRGAHATHPAPLLMVESTSH